jgi:hypothetical protein
MLGFLSHAFVWPHANSAVSVPSRQLEAAVSSSFCEHRSGISGHLVMGSISSKRLRDELIEPLRSVCAGRSTRVKIACCVASLVLGAA